MRKIVLTATLILLFAVSFASAQTKPEDRLKTFEQVWKTINDKYFDDKFNGVDWNKVKTDYRPKIEAVKNDDEFYDLVKEMVRELHDAHTRFWTPKEAELRKRKQYSSIGLAIDRFAEGFFVTSVAPNSEAEKSGVKVGMAIIKINGQEIVEAFSKALETFKSSTPQAVKLLTLRSLFRGDAGSKVNLSLRDQDGKLLEVTLTRTVFDRSFEVKTKILDGNIGYLKFDTFDSRNVKDLKIALETLKDTKGLVIDLRDNGGGEINVVMTLAGLLFKDKSSFGGMKLRGKGSKDLVIKGNKSAYANPIVVLIDNDSASGSELLSQGLQDNNRAKIIGSVSCGCLLGIKGAKDFPAGELEFSEIGFVSAKGKVVEGNGVSPDLKFEVQLKDLLENYDRALAEALKYFANRNS